MHQETWVRVEAIAQWLTPSPTDILFFYFLSFFLFLSWLETRHSPEAGDGPGPGKDFSELLLGGLVRDVADCGAWWTEQAIQ